MGTILAADMAERESSTKRALLVGISVEAKETEGAVFDPEMKDMVQWKKKQESGWMLEQRYKVNNRYTRILGDKTSF